MNGSVRSATAPSVCCLKCRALEIGSWGGASSYCISKVLKSVGEDNRLVCMDTWKGTPNTNSHQIANYEDMFCHFRTAMSYFGVSDIIIPIIASSEYGLGLLENYSYDVIFIVIFYRRNSYIFGSY